MREFSEEYDGICGSWLWDSVQVDVTTLQDLYGDLGYKLTRSESYDVWYLYSEHCCANWMCVDSNSDISRSVIFIDEARSDWK